MGKSCSALSASSLEYLSSVCSAHSLAEAVLLFSLKLFRLVCSKHFCHSFSLAFNDVTLYYIHILGDLSSVLRNYFYFLTLSAALSVRKVENTPFLLLAIFFI